MSERTYKICLSVPLGSRDGILYINESEREITGWLDVMMHKNPLTGTLEADGKFVFKGEIKTLVSVIPYNAAGMICGNKLLALLKTASHQYSISGEEIRADEKLL